MCPKSPQDIHSNRAENGDKKGVTSEVTPGLICGKTRVSFSNATRYRRCPLIRPTTSGPVYRTQTDGRYGR